MQLGLALRELIALGQHRLALRRHRLGHLRLLPQLRVGVSGAQQLRPALLQLAHPGVERVHLLRLLAQVRVRLHGGAEDVPHGHEAAVLLLELRREFVRHQRAVRAHLLRQLRQERRAGPRGDGGADLAKTNRRALVFVVGQLLLVVLVMQLLLQLHLRLLLFTESRGELGELAQLRLVLDFGRHFTLRDGDAARHLLLLLFQLGDALLQLHRVLGRLARLVRLLKVGEAKHSRASLGFR